MKLGETLHSLVQQQHSHEQTDLTERTQQEVVEEAAAEADDHVLSSIMDRCLDHLPLRLLDDLLDLEELELVQVVEAAEADDLW